MLTEDTIFALASAPGRAGIAVIRISGPAAAAALAKLGCVLPVPRKAVRARLTDPHSHELLDDGLVLWFPAPHSFTGEDVVELHVHGGRAIVASLLEALARMGLRPAEPGAFTRRAFAHDKMDLTQAEALADAIDAETRVQAKQALRQMGGALKELYDDWRHRLVQALAHLEAVIDFPDEDLPSDVADKIWPDVRDLIRAIRAHLDDNRRGERVRAGVRIVIVGPPNAGKSSLLNWLARREAAIVSNIPGTTRDVIEVHLDIAGYAVTVVDTAGLRTTTDIIEHEGVRRAQTQAADADIKIVLFDGATYPARDADAAALVDGNALVTVNKADLLRDKIDPAAHFISVATGAGMDIFMTALEHMVKERMDGGAAVPLTRERHRHGLEDCVASLERAIKAGLPELASEDLRVAARALGRLTGRVEVDEILDVVFRDFCIGK
jgi:tRNA modification GTPase